MDSYNFISISIKFVLFLSLVGVVVSVLNTTSKAIRLNLELCCTKLKIANCW